MTIPGVQMAALTQRIFYIDQQNFLVLKMQFSRHSDSDNAPNSSFKAEIYYSNYQSVNGLLFPMKIDSYLESRQTSTVSLTTLSLNSGLQDNEFTVTCGGSNAN
jgi:hypothetical protein